MTPAHRPDAVGILDASVADTAGKRWGIQTLGDSYVVFQDPFSYGSANGYSPDYWLTTKQVTIDFLIELPATGFVPGSPLFGSGVPVDQPTPLFFSRGTAPDLIQVSFKTGDFAPEAGSGDRRFAFSIPTTGAHRVAVQFDLTQAIVSVYVDAFQVSILPLANMGPNDPNPFSAAANLSFIQNDHWPFMLGASGMRGPFNQGTSATDLHLYGFHVQAALRYANNGTGTAIRSLKGTPINDAFRFFSSETGTIGFITFQDDPNQPLDSGGRTVTSSFSESRQLGSGLFLNTINSGPLVNNGVVGLWITGSSRGSPAIAIGSVTHFVMSRLEIRGYQAVGSFPVSFPSEDIQLNYSMLEGYNVPYFGAFQRLQAQNLALNAGGIRMYASSDSWKDVIVNPNAVSDTEYASYGGPFGGTHFLQNFTYDSEGSSVRRAAFYCENHPGLATTLTLDTVYTGTIGNTAALIVLRDGGTADQGYLPAQLVARNFFGTLGYRVAFSSDGPLWAGDLPAFQLTPPLLEKTGRFGSTSSLTLNPSGLLSSTATWPTPHAEIRLANPILPLDTKGEMTADITRFGASPTASPSTNALAIQAAVDSLIAKTGTTVHSPTGVVYVPPSAVPYQIDRPIQIDLGNIEIRGEGQTSQIQMAPGILSPAFLFGVRRVEASNRIIDGTHRPDAYGILDSSAAPAPGKLFGIRTNNDSYVDIQAGMNLGVVDDKGSPDYWQSVTKLTIDVALAIPAGGFANKYFVGMGDFGTYTSPWSLIGGSSADELRFSFVTSDIPDRAISVDREFYFHTGAGATGTLKRITLQVDLDNALVTVFVDGLQVALSQTSNLSANSSLPFVPRLKFRRNFEYPLMIGGNGLVAIGDGVNSGEDISLYGLHLWQGLRYDETGLPGSQQRFIDSAQGVLNDRARYFTVGEGTIGLLGLTDNPATAQRTITIQHGPVFAGGGTGYGLFLHCMNSGGLVNNAVRGLKIIQNIGGGPGIAIGEVLFLVMENIEVMGGLQAVANYPTFGANYVNSLLHAHLQGTDTAFYGYSQLLTGKDVYIEPARGTGVRMTASSGHWQNLHISAGPVANSYYQILPGIYGGQTILEDLVFTAPDNAQIESGEIDLSTIAYGISSFELDGISFAPAGKGSLLQFRDPGQTAAAGVYPFGLFSARGLLAPNQHRFAYDSDGSGWIGELPTAGLPGTNFWTFTSRWGAPQLQLKK